MGVGMLFLLELSGHRPLPSLLLYPFAYLPPALFLYRLFFKTLLVQDFTLGPLGWVEVKTEDLIWLIIFWAYTLTSLSLGFSSLIKKARSSSSRRERLRTTFIIKAGILTTILGLITNMILPLIGRGPVPALAPIFLIIFSAATFTAVVRYRIMVIDPVITADKVLDLINDMVILLDNEHNIKSLNKSVCKTFGLKKDEPLNQKIFSVFPNIKEFLCNNKKNDHQIETYLWTERSEQIYVLLRVLPIKDQFGDKIGTLLVISDLRNVQNLMNEIEEHKRTQAQLLDLQKTLELRVEERTKRLVDLNRKLLLESQEKERLYDKLLKKEEIFRRVIEFYPDPAAIIDMRGEVLYLNQSFAGLLEILKDQPIFKFKSLQSFKGIHTEEMEIGQRFMHTTVFPISGEEEGFAIILKDVTELKMREIELKKAYERYHRILEEITDGYYETDLKGRFTFFNPSWARILGVLPEKLKGASYKNFIPQELHKDVFFTFNRVYETKIRIGSYKLTHLTPGGLRELELSISPVLDKEGNVVGFRGIGRDITEKVEGERLLKESEEKFRRLFETINHPIFLMERESILDCNPASEVVFKTERANIIGKTPFDFSPEYQPDGESSSEKGKHYIILAMQGERISFEWKHMRADKTLFDAHVTLDRLIIGGKIYLFAFVYDLTERKLLEERLRMSSITDELTALYNRRGFFEMGERMLRTASRLKKGIFLTFADLNGLKIINDTYGHQAGDIAIKEFGSLLKSIHRETDVVARIGGDEFVVLAMESDERVDSESILKRVKDELQKYNAQKKLKFELTASIGITRWEPGSDISMEDLIAEADRLMYMDKAKKFKTNTSK